MKSNIIFNTVILLLSQSILIKTQCELTEINPNDYTTLTFHDTIQSCLYYDITQMEQDTEGIITFSLHYEILMDNNLGQLNAQIITLENKEDSLSPSYFPFKKHEGNIYFPVESPIENLREQRLSNLKHIYFRKENSNKNDKSKTYLLIYFEVSVRNHDPHYEYSVGIMKPTLLQKAFHLDFKGTEPSSVSGFEFRAAAYEPDYSIINYSDSTIIHNYLILSKNTLISYTCESLLIKKNNSYIINPNRYIGYFFDFKTLNSNSRQCTKVIMKVLFSGQGHKNISFNVMHLNHEFKGFPVFDVYQNSYSVDMEVTDIDKYYHLLGMFPNTNNNKYYVQVKYFFGIGDIYYKTSTVFKDISSTTYDSSYIKYSDNTFLVELSNMNNEYNIFHLKCETFCLVHFELFEIQSHDKVIYNSLHIEFPGVYFVNIFENKKYYIEFVNFPIFNIEIENLNGGLIDGVIEQDKFTLTQEKNIYRGFHDYSGMLDYETPQMTFLSKNDNCLIKIKINYWDVVEEIAINTHGYYSIKKYQYYYKTFLFKLPYDDVKYDSYQIQILSKDESNLNNNAPISLYSCFDVGNDVNLKLPSAYNSLIDYLTEPTYKFTAEISNPYDRPFSIISKAHTKMYYYYAVHFYNYTEELNVFIAFTGVNKPNYNYLNINEINYVHIHALTDSDTNNIQNNNTYLLHKGGKYRDSSLIINFFKCDNDVSFHIQQLNNKTMISNNINIDNLRYITKDIGIDYILSFNNKMHINRSKNSQVLVYYAYESNEKLQSFQEYLNNTVHYNIITKNRKKCIEVTFKPFLISGKDVSYSIYLSPFEIEDNKCGFINREPILTTQHNDINREDIKIEVNDVKSGKYKLNVVAKENNIHHSFKIYDSVFVEIIAYPYNEVLILKSMIIILALFSIMMSIFIIKTQGSALSVHNKKTKLRDKSSFKKHNINSMQLEDK